MTQGTTEPPIITRIELANVAVGTATNVAEVYEGYPPHLISINRRHPAHAGVRGTEI